MSGQTIISSCWAACCWMPLFAITFCSVHVRPTMKRVLPHENLLSSHPTNSTALVLSCLLQQSAARTPRNSSGTSVHCFHERRLSASRWSIYATPSPRSPFPSSFPHSVAWRFRSITEIVPLPFKCSLQKIASFIFTTFSWLFPFQRERSALCGRERSSSNVLRHVVNRY